MTRNQALAKIRSMHTKTDAGGGLTDGWCAECGWTWPCPTYHVAAGWGADRRRATGACRLARRRRESADGGVAMPRRRGGRELLGSTPTRCRLWGCGVTCVAAGYSVDPPLSDVAGGLPGSGLPVDAGRGSLSLEFHPCVLSSFTSQADRREAA